MCNEVHSKNYKSCENQHLSLLLLAIFFSVLKYNIFAFMCVFVIGSWEDQILFLAPKSLQMVTAAMKLKDAYSLEGKL